MGIGLGGRGGLAIAAGLWLWAGCGDDKVSGREDHQVDAVCDLEGVAACVTDADCGEGLGCSDDCCIPTCASEADCGSGCGPLGCVCDEGFCQARVCSSDSGCSEGQVCADGACVAAPAPEQAASCALTPAFAPIRDGGTLSLAVKAYGTDGEPLPLSEGFTFESSAPARATVDESGVVTGGVDAGEVVITARIGGASCSATLTNYAAPPADSLRVVVIDELTGLPVSNAQVQVETGATPLSMSTDENGSAVFDHEMLPPSPFVISAFAEDYAWVTVVDASANDLLLPVRRLVPADLAGGFTGTFGPDSIFDPEDVHAGVAGTSIPGNLIDLSLPILVGPSQVTRVTIGEERDVKIPSGVVLGLGNTWFKEQYEALGVPGVCADRAKTEAGLCGTRTAWGIAGGVPLIDLPLDRITEDGEDLSVGELLAQLLPQFRRFRSAVVRDVTFEMAPEVAGRPDPAKLTPLDLQATQRLSLLAPLQLPQLPAAASGSGFLDGVIGIGGADVIGRGVVPLGLTAGVDAAEGETPDGKINDLDGNSTGELALRMAPQHGGIEGSEYVVLALAANFGALTDENATCTAEDRSGCTALSGLVWTGDSVAFGQPIDLRDGGFVGLASGAAWDPASRTFTRGTVASGDPQIYRLRLSAGDGKTWYVWMPSSMATFTVPVPAGGGDRAASARASVQALRLSTDFERLLSWEDGRLSDLVPVITGFSTLDLPRP